ncbi:hypothetical protein HaLaN_17069 [Haematococcus lacustris]|uniref:Uncharacterized protein n=1 Tax=Haematococcus lacustris TaxID=44745 RepID=A0A699ZFK0_HAELA|nr:hypothetical protein HaLaN_17069 [Haematococcus lacustris]
MWCASQVKAPPAYSARMGAPRALACSYSSNTKAPAWQQQASSHRFRTIRRAGSRRRRQLVKDSCAVTALVWSCAPSLKGWAANDCEDGFPNHSRELREELLQVARPAPTPSSRKSAREGRRDNGGQGQ